MGVVYEFDALKQPGVQSHVVGVLSQDGLYLLCQSIHLVVRFCTQQIEENGRNPRQQVVVALILLRINNGVVEGGLLGVVDDFLYLLVIPADALHEGLLIIFHTDTVKGHRIVRCVVRFKKWILTIAHTILTFFSLKIVQRYNKCTKKHHD